jgi:hypothetical protein
MKFKLHFNASVKPASVSNYIQSFALVVCVFSIGFIFSKGPVKAINTGDGKRRKQAAQSVSLYRCGGLYT